MKRNRQNAKQKEQRKKEMIRKRNEQAQQRKETVHQEIAIQQDQCMQSTYVSQKKKYHAKALGLKSVLVMGDRLAVTSFLDAKITSADGSETVKAANLEKVTTLEGEAIKTVPAQERMFHVEVDPEKIDLQTKNPSEGVKFSFENPGKTNIGEDYIGIKNRLEEEFFGKAYQRDNLHVQIAYNVLDIKKILGTYINNIIYIFYNLNRGADEMDRQVFEDLLGVLYTDNTLEDQEQYIQKLFQEGDTKKAEEKQRHLEEVRRLLKNTSAYHVYFGTLFRRADKFDAPKGLTEEELRARKKAFYQEQDKKNLSYNYNILRLLSVARQLCMHAKNNGGLAESALFNLESTLQSAPELLSILNEKYKDGIKKLNNGFVGNAKNNLYILRKVYPDVPLEKLTEMYYRLTIRKETRNFGINLRQLRQNMIEQYFGKVCDVRGEQYDSFRNKIHTVLDFILMDYMLCNDNAKNGSIRQQMIDELRLAEKDEAAKKNIYKAYAARYWEKVQKRWELAWNAILAQEQQERKFSGEVELEDIAQKDYAISEQNTDCFVKFLYFICKFLDGKEINELLCALINKFDNIADLLETGRMCGRSVEFQQEYAFFNESRKIGEQIRTVKNLASMEFTGVKKQKKRSKDNELAYPEIVYRDALALLGYSFPKYTTDRDLSGIPEEEREKYYTPQYKEFREIFYEKQKIDAGRVLYNKNGTVKLDHKVRNFICNNILMSKWFFYVVKYNRPVECRNLISNEKMLKFVLYDIPETQINRYYETVTGKREDVSTDGKRDALVNALKDFSGKSILEDIFCIPDADYKKQVKGSLKEKKKAIVRLYLTVAYLITKSMVKVNTRFSIAFSMLERDAYLKFGKVDKDNLMALTKQYFDEANAFYEARGKEREEICREQDPANRNQKLNAWRKEGRGKAHYTYHWWQCLKTNLDEAKKLNWYVGKSQKVYSDYRNAVAHLNVINEMNTYLESATVTSYYGFYCYCMQRYLLDKNSNAEVMKVMASVKETGTYSRDLMWLLNLPLAYNLPRYKNLSSEALYYDREKVEQAQKEQS